MRVNNKHKYSSKDAEECIELALSHITTTNNGVHTNIDWDSVRLESIRLLSRVRNTKTGMELRDRFVWSMTNLHRQISNDAIAKQATLIINTARNGD